MRLFALQQICEERGLETAPGEDGREGLVRRILAAEAEAADQDRGEGSRDGAILEIPPAAPAVEVERLRRRHPKSQSEWRLHLLMLMGQRKAVRGGRK